MRIGTSVFAAIVAQFISLVLVIGGSDFAESIGWGLGLEMFIVIPSIILYSILFSVLDGSRVPPWLFSPVSALASAVIALSATEKISMTNWILIGAVAGGSVGGLVLSMRARSLA